MTSFVAKDSSVDYENTTQRVYIYGFDGNGVLNFIYRIIYSKKLI